ncbi:MAG: hypothetical protein RLN70_02335, partial [Rhodospirillaceae bacterium]
APENTLGVYVADYGQGIVRIVSQIQDGEFEASGNIVFGIKDTDVMTFSYNDHSARPVPDAIRRKVEEVKNAIIAGEIATRAE